MNRQEKREADWEDDGRTIVNMNVEGMPGYRRQLDAKPPVSAPNHRPKEMLSPRETRQVMLASMKWAFLFSMGFVIIMVLFLLFCVKVWFA
jgi:hypothetical protein